MSPPYGDEAARARAALAVVPADEYVTWVDMAFALKHGFGDAGFEIWDEWSRTAGNYDERAARTTWRSVKESGGKTLASLFWLARQHGFDLRRTHYPDRMATALVPSAEVLRRRASEESRQQTRHAAVAREAQAIWKWGRPVGPEHPYLVRKHLEPTRTLRELEAPELHTLLGYIPESEEQPLTGRVLLVPFWVGEAISTLELIDEYGRKSSLAGGVKRGGYWIAGPAPTDREPHAPILIGEGMATVLSAHRATGWVALAALSSGTMPQVAGILRERFPDVELVVLGDVGPGEVKARQAAEETQAHLALPIFGGDARIDDKAPTDFNDMAVLSGHASVGDRLREIAFRNIELAIRGPGPTVVTTTGAERVEPKEKMMSSVNENSISDTEGGSCRQSSKRGVTEHATGLEPRIEERCSADVEHPAAESSASLPVAGSPAARASRPMLTRRPVGEQLFDLAEVPSGVRALAEHRFGTPLRMGIPREHGGPYRGEVFNTEHYLIQAVATRSVVFHPKEQMEFISERLRWMDENARLNGSELQVAYDGDRPKVYPWDRARELLERTVGSLKRSARELNFSANVEATLDQLEARSWARMREFRAAALEQSKERATSQDPPEKDC